MRKNIPIQLTRFIGRQREIAAVTGLLANTRLLTLTGFGGSGKTRLAREVVAQLDSGDEGDTIWVDLAPISAQSLVWQAVAKALDITEQPDRPFHELIIAALQERRLLLILDNCEHLISACAQLVGRLLSACAHLRVLATSRESLGIKGERVYSVHGLSFPTAGALARINTTKTLSSDAVEDLARYESLNLFLDRAVAVRSDFELTSQNARAIATVCHRLDGMPLAIELAAARVNVLTADQIAARLDDQLALLTSKKRRGGTRRHRSLRAAFDWSYGLLSPVEKATLRRLSVFAGGCSLKTAHAVCDGDGAEREQLLAPLESLVNKSLVIAQTVRGGEARYSLLESVRQYAAQKLEAAGEGPSVRNRHLQCFLQLVEEVEPKLKGKYQQLWLNWLETEVDNIRAALAWSLKSTQIEIGLRIASAVYLLWAIRGYVEEGARWLEQLLTIAGDDVSPAVQVNALASAAFLAIFRKDHVAQMEYGRQAAHIAATVDDVSKQALIWALFTEAAGALAAGDYQTDYRLRQRIIRLARELGDEYLLGVALSASNTAAMNVGKYGEARAMLEEGLSYLQKWRDSHRIGMTLNFLGDLERCEKNYHQALKYYEASLPMLREVDAERDSASVMHNLGHACLHRRDVERAHSLFCQSMAIHREQQNEPGMAECLIGFAALAILGGEPAAGARLLAAARAIGGENMTAAWPATRMEFEHYQGLAQKSLGEQALLSEQILGSSLSIEEAVAVAQEMGRKSLNVHKRTRQIDELTPREREVATLIAQAKSNGEIAEALVLSKRTVESHIANIRSKLEFTERAQIVRWAIESGLTEVGGRDPL